MELGTAARFCQLNRRLRQASDFVLDYANTNRAPLSEVRSEKFEAGLLSSRF